MSRKNTVLLIAFCLLGTCGCQGRFLGPAGPMKYQQSRSVINDPFPQADIGPSDMTMRPPGFEQPLPEAVRGRLAHDSMPWVIREDRR